MKRSKLTAKPVGLKQANEIVSKLHRHHRPTRGCKFCIACVDENGDMVGVAITGRPIARRLDDGYTLEVLRVATDGTANACSFLLGRAARAAKAIGYKRILTYTLITEPGSSLRGAGWTHTATSPGGSWNQPGRPRQTGLFPECEKKRWELDL